MERKIARFNVKIIFQKNTVYEDAYKNQRTRWENYFTCHAYASTFTGDESEGEVTYENRTVTFETRACSELTPVNSKEYRILFKGEAYDIEYVDPMNYQGRTMKFKARREVRPDGQEGNN